MNFDLKELNSYVDNTIICREKHPNANLYIYGYYTSLTLPTIWDEISIHCRGMIVDALGNVLEHPFNKFWTFKQYLNKYTVLLNDNQIMKIPEGDFRIIEKIDGTMCTLYWINNKPYLATQRSFTNPKALEATKILYEKYNHLFSKLDKKYTYIFEAVYPESKVLIDYGNTRDLFLIGMIDKKSDIPLELPDIGFPRAKDYTKKYAHIKNFNDLIALNLPNQEGFVIYLSDGKMMKLKFPWYQEAHRLLGLIIQKDFAYFRMHKELITIFGKEKKVINTIDVWNALCKKDYSLNSIYANVPSYYFLMGFEYWVNAQKNKILNGVKYKHQRLAKPNEIDVFDFEERSKKPHVYESTVWNWEKRYLK